MYNADWMSAEHEAYAETVRRFSEDELLPHRERWQKSGKVDRSLWSRAGKLGILGATLPEAFGGSACPRSFDAVTVYEQTLIGDTNWGFTVFTYVAHYIATYGTDEQKQKWLPGLIAGEIIPAIAMTEPSTGSDLQAIKTTAILDGEEYVLNGSKTFISNGQLADLICVVAKTDPEQGSKGVSIIVLETDGAEGFTRGRNLEKLGLKGQDTSELFFDDVRIPKENILGGEPGRGFYQLMEQLAWERLSIAIAGIGSCDRALALTLEYVKERRAFSNRVFDFQNTRFKLADVSTKIEVTRAFLDQCTAKLDEGALDATTAAMAKLWTANAQCEIVDDCLQFFGGYGYMMEYPIAHLYADARVQRLHGGADEIMRELVARRLDG